MWSQLFTALGYLKVRLKGKLYFDLGYPLSASLLVTICVFYLGVDIRFFGEGGLVTTATNLFGVLIGFFITALAAVATFSNRAVDKPLNGEGAFVDGKELTRRQFLCFLFGYLTFLSFCLFFTSMAAAAIHGRAWAAHVGVYAQPLRFASLLLFSFALAHLFSICLLGMHYLIYRLHVPTVRSVSVSGRSDEPEAKD